MRTQPPTSPIGGNSHARSSNREIRRRETKLSLGEFLNEFEPSLETSNRGKPKRKETQISLTEFLREPKPDKMSPSDEKLMTAEFLNDAGIENEPWEGWLLIRVRISSCKFDNIRSCDRRY